MTAKVSTTIHGTSLYLKSRSNHSPGAFKTYNEKVSEHPRQKFVQYKLLQNSEVFVKQNQVFCSAMNVSTDLRIEMDEYLWLSDCI